MCMVSFHHHTAEPSLRSALNNSILTVTHAYARRCHIACFFIRVHVSLSSKHLLQRNPFICHLRTVLHIPTHSGNALPVYYPLCHASHSPTLAFEDSSKTLVKPVLDFIECFTTTFLRAHSWLNWVEVKPVA